MILNAFSVGWIKFKNKKIKFGLLNQIMGKKLIIKDLDHRFYEVKNIDHFMKHLYTFHTNAKGLGDNSLHEENGYYFKITPEFLEAVKKQVNQL